MSECRHKFDEEDSCMVQMCSLCYISKDKATIHLQDKIIEKLKEGIDYYANEEEHKSARKHGCYVTGVQAREVKKEVKLLEKELDNE